MNALGRMSEENKSQAVGDPAPKQGDLGKKLLIAAAIAAAVIIGMTVVGFAFALVPLLVAAALAFAIIPIALWIYALFSSPQG